MSQNGPPLALILAAALGAGACGRQEPAAPAKQETPAVKSWDVLKDGRKVLTIKKGPGTLVSTALLPPGVAPVVHPFLSARAYDAGEEQALRSLLDRSDSFESFVALLEKNGYLVAPAEKISP